MITDEMIEAARLEIMETFDLLNCGEEQAKAVLTAALSTVPSAGAEAVIPAPRGGHEPNWWEEWVKTTRAYNRLAKAAQAVIDETKAIHDNEPWPIRYRAPYDAITKLTEALVASDQSVAVSTPASEAHGISSEELAVIDPMHPDFPDALLAVTPEQGETAPSYEIQVVVTDSMVAAPRPHIGMRSTTGAATATSAMKRPSEPRLLRSEARQMSDEPKRKKTSYVGVPAIFELTMACNVLIRAYGASIYHVGSSLQRPDWRDVDLVMILDDADFAREFPNAPLHSAAWEHDPKWLVLTVSLSKWLAKKAGVPVDFKFQPRTFANERHTGPRNQIGRFINHHPTDEEEDDAR